MPDHTESVGPLTYEESGDLAFLRRANGDTLCFEVIGSDRARELLRIYHCTQVAPKMAEAMELVREWRNIRGKARETAFCDKYRLANEHSLQRRMDAREYVDGKVDEALAAYRQGVKHG